MKLAKNQILDMLVEIRADLKHVSNNWLYEYKPDLVTSAIEAFGSLRAAAEEAGLDPTEFFSGFDPGTSKSLNETFIHVVTGILEHHGIHLKKQDEILAPEKLLDPVRVDQQGLWYIVKIIPVSNLTRNLAKRILEITDRGLTVIYLKKSPGIEEISSINFKHVDYYLRDINDDDLTREIRTIASCLNVVAFRI